MNFRPPMYDHEKLDVESHTIDPDGNVTIVLQNPDAPFAVWTSGDSATEYFGPRTRIENHQVYRER